MRHTPWVVSEHVPDFSSLERMLRHPRFAGKQGEALAVAIWGLIVDRELGLFHYGPPMEPFWNKSTQDPLKTFNAFGYSICRCHAHIQAILGRAAGLTSRIANVAGHEGTEFFYDGRWHYFDCDIQMFYRLRPPQAHVIASREDLHRDSSLVTDQPNPSNPYHIPDREPESVRAIYESEPEYLPVLEECIHSVDFRLRPGETLRRYFHPRGRWHVFDENVPSFRKFRDGMTSVEGPTERFWPRRQWGNGFLRYAPRLEKGFRDLELGADEVAGLDQDAEGLRVREGQGHAAFAFESPYLFCGVPDPLKRVPSALGAELELSLELPPGASARVAVAREYSDEWIEIHKSAKAGAAKERVDFTAAVDGSFRFRVRVELQGQGARLRALEALCWVMASPHALPALRNAGANKMSFHSGDRFGLPTRPLLKEFHVHKPDALEHLHSSHNLKHDPKSYAGFLPANAAEPWQAVCELRAPGGGKVAWLAAYALIEGSRPGAPDETPARIEVAASPDGPWKTIAEAAIVEHPEGWHFGVFGETRLAEPSERVYVRFAARKGAKGFRIAAHYLPAAPAPKNVPLEIEHVWFEDDPKVGRRARRHVERTTADEGAYEVRCAQAPHNEYIELRVPPLPAK